LAVACPACRADNEPGDRFCGECGSALAEGIEPATAQADTPDRTAAASERRLVSVLFADLVGFTTLSESRDAEEVRELLTKYFDTCRRLIERYGGVVEKFIGDAVMAVWGTPVAREDDAERAVRAALELVDAVAELGQEAKAPGLRARAGVLTGEAAVTLGATGEGMVAGDLVNTASRIQSAADPGTVFVGEATRRSTEASIAYEDAGTFELKGKAEPVPLWRALRIVAGVGGAMKSAGLEAPFVGRDREIRLMKELFHASAEEGKAHLVTVSGIAGIGKSRLAWEFYKYTDGLRTEVWWHRGRCLAYGEGVTYWALVEMIRGRAGIVEGEDVATAAEKLHATVEQLVSDPEEQRWVEPRLAHLLGLEERAPERESLFAAWRLFIERMAQQDPVMLLFEDMQWADASLLDFIEYLLEWSRNLPVFVVVIARPELFSRRANWGAGTRNATLLSLEPLAVETMKEMLAGLVPGLPDELRDQILDRAEGVPLYAVETVRMLLDRGLLAQEGSVYRPTGAITALEVPETLHALIAARLDGLTVEERRTLQDASVLGKTFTRDQLARFSGREEAVIDPILTSLVRKEVLSIQADPRSPERGQYGFLQDLVKHVAYEMISKRERRAAHLAAAALLAESIDADEIVEVRASHYLDAYKLFPDASDAPEIKAKAQRMLARAGERASSLAALGEAQRFFTQAAEVSDDPVARAEMLENAGMAARSAADADSAMRLYTSAEEIFKAQGLNHPAARVAARRAEVMWDRGRLAEAVDDMDQAFRVLANDEPDEDLAWLAAQLARSHLFAGHPDKALEVVEVAIDIAEGLLLPEVLSQALNTKAVVLYGFRGRNREGFALLKFALEVALENELSSTALRAYYNLADISAQSDQHREAADFCASGLALARRVGNRFWELNMLGQFYSLLALGEWDLLLDRAGQMPAEKAAENRGAYVGFLIVVPRIHLLRGDVDAAKRAVALFPTPDATADVQEQVAYQAGLAMISRTEGSPSDGLRFAERALGFEETLGARTDAWKEAFIEAVETSFELGDLARVERFLHRIESDKPGVRSRYLEAHSFRFRARLAAARGDDERAEQNFKNAVGSFVEMEVPFWAAGAQLEHAEWLAERGRGGEAQPLLAEAVPVFERLRAQPFVDRAKNIVGAPLESI
jgi:class 3 adenylate cyclase/tetratricopeptide (TPR) repeat protein